MRKWTETYWKNVVHGCDPWKSRESLHILSLKNFTSRMQGNGFETQRMGISCTTLAHA